MSNITPDDVVKKFDDALKAANSSSNPSKAWNDAAREILRQSYTSIVEKFASEGKRPMGKWGFMVSGSLARNEATPWSDLDAFIIIENEADAPLFKEMGSEFYSLFDKVAGDRRAFIFDPVQINPFKMVGTPEGILKSAIEIDVVEQVDAIANSKYIFGSGPELETRLLQAVKSGLSAGKYAMVGSEGGYKQLKRAYELFKPWGGGDKINIKSYIGRPLTLVLNGLAKIYGIKELGADAQADALLKAGGVSAEFCGWVKETNNIYQKLRYFSHESAGMESDVVDLANVNLELARALAGRAVELQRMAREFVEFKPGFFSKQYKGFKVPSLNPLPALDVDTENPSGQAIKIIVQLEDGDEVSAASRFLMEKANRKAGAWIKWDSASRRFLSIEGDVASIKGKVNIVIVGHGENSSEGAVDLVSGFTSMELSDKLTNISKNMEISEISMVACKVADEKSMSTSDGVKNSFAGRLFDELTRHGEKIHSISVRDTMLQVDQFGRKWTMTLTNGDGEPVWAHGDGARKWVVTRNDQGKLQADKTLVSPDMGKDVIQGGSGPLGRSPVRVGDITIEPVLLNAMGVRDPDGRLSEAGLNALKDAVTGVIDPAKLHFDRNVFTAYFTDSHDAVTLQQAAKLVKAMLKAAKNDAGKLFGDTAIAGTNTLGDQYSETIGSYVTEVGEVSSSLSTELQRVASDYQQKRLLEQFEDAFGLDSSNAQTANNFLKYAEQLSGVTVSELDALRTRFPTLTESQLVEKAAVEATRRSLQGHTQAEEVLQVGRWTYTDAERFLAYNGILIRSFGGESVVKAGALESLISHGSSLDHIRLVTALHLIDQNVATAATAELLNSSDPEVRNLGRVLSSNASNEWKPITPKGATISTVGGDALAVFTTLTSIQGIITNWSQLSSAQQGLDITGVVGGLATTSVASKAISSAFAEAGFALSEVGEAVKGSVLGLALAPITFASIGLQWQDFWKNGGDTSSLAYRSLVASTVITTVTTAASIALSAVSIAASLGAVAATSILGAVAAAAGPIGVAIGAAAFLVNGIVQGAMQVAKYDQDFDNVGDKVEQFFAAWVGVQTDGLQRATARQEGRQDAERQQKSLTDQWAVTQQYLSDVFAKDGYSQLAVRDRTYAVKNAVVPVNDRSTDANMYSYLLQSSPTYNQDIKYIRSNSVVDGNSVWSELGDKPDVAVNGTQGKRNLFNLDGATNLKAVNGGDQNDVFNLARNAQVQTLSGGGGDDTLIWQAGNVKAPSDVVSVEIDTVTGRAFAHDDTANPQGDQYLQRFSVSKIQNFSISATGNVVIRAEDDKNHLLEAKAARGDLYGGSGTNTFVLNNNTYAYSRSNDLFLWTAGATASIQLSPGSSRFTLPNGARIGDGSQKLPVSDAQQAAFIELPYAYADLRVSRDSHALKLTAKNGATLTIDNMFDLSGTTQKNKLLQLRDKDGRTFSLNLPDGFPDGAYSVELAEVPKAFVFRQAGTAERDASHPLYLHGDRAANAYNFQAASGYFVIDPKTTPYMTLLLNTDVAGIQYSYGADGALTLMHQGSNGILSIKIMNYANVKAQLNIYATKAVQGASASQSAEPAWAKLALPTSGTGRLGVQDTVRLDETLGLDKLPALPSDEVITLNVSEGSNTPSPGIESRNLSGSDLHHWVISAEAAPRLPILVEDTKNLAYLRRADDLIIYDASKLDKTYGLSGTTYLRVQDYFLKSTVNLTVNGTIIGGSSITAATSIYMGTDKDDQINLPATYTALLGSNGADRYRVDMTTGKTFTIDNMATDSIRDELHLHGVTSIGDLSLSKNGVDLMLRNNTTTVVLKNYLQDADRRHLSLRINDGDSFNYVIPVVGADNSIDYYEIDSQPAGQRVHIFNRNKTNLIDIGAGTGPNTVTVDLLTDIGNYGKEVVGSDLKLVSSDGKSTIYLANYYAFPEAISFAWNGQTRETGTVLPDNWHQDLLDAGVSREWLVRYVNAGLTTESAAKTALAFQNNLYLKPIGNNVDAKSQMDTANALSAFIPLAVPSFGPISLLTVFGNRESGGGTGFEFSINNSGDLILKANALDNNYYNQTLRSNFVGAGEKTSLLFTYDPSTRDLYVWKQGNNRPLYARDLGNAFQQAWTQGTGFYTNAGSAGKLYIGNPAQISAAPGAAITNDSAIALTGPQSNDVAKAIFRLEGVSGVTSDVIDRLVDVEGITSLSNIRRAVDWLNLGVTNPDVVAVMIGAGADSENYKSKAGYINSLLSEKAGALFIYKAMFADLSLGDALLYSRAGVDPSELDLVKAVLQSGGVGDREIMRKALLVKGYKSNAAQQLAPILAETGLSTRTQVSAFLDAGYTDIAAVKRYIRAGVSVGELEAGNRNQGAYASGDRRKLVSVSVSDSLAQPVTSIRHYLDQDYTDSGGYTLKTGQLLEAGALTNPNYSLRDAKITTVIEGTVSQFKGNSMLDNLVDGQSKAGDAWSWSWKSLTDTDGKTEKKLRLSDQGWIEFDLQDKIALTSIQLKGQGGDGTAVNLKVQAKGANGQWADVSTGSTWTPSGDSTFTLNLNALDVPYNAYRVAFQQGDLPTNFWVKEVDFTTKSLGLQPQAAALVQSIAGFGSSPNGGMNALTPSAGSEPKQPQLLAGRVL
ncbi:C80 family cysteine peptidase [Burkholderia thailandensis]|uniref:C80 family cysteine peptidase n=1 Tax=Burkholderia thailandensis TaxID=57975 RepID=UPI002D77B3B2|nr:C80 family cysteine peptidase [Burkholderia thailandensis]WRS69938.1 C80 family cysteine peptidase [Burkholderia thailandensis]